MLGRQLHLFLDFDDTLSDFASHTVLYAGRLSENLARDFGGEPPEWAAVLKPAIMASIGRYAEKFKSNPLAGICAWIPVERARIAAEIFQSVGRDLPAEIAPDELTLSIQTAALQACKGGAFYPGAIEALRVIDDSGVRLHMASSHESRYLAAVLRGAGIDDMFDSFFGADLIDCAKEGTEYYCRMFEACGIRPDQAVVLDDGVDCLRWAEACGAHVIQARLRENPPAKEFGAILSDWRDLLGLLQAIASSQPVGFA